MITLHADCQRRLQQLFYDAVSKVRFRNGYLLDPWSLTGFDAASEALPTHWRAKVSEWISDTPIRDFIYGVLSEELRELHKYDKSDELRPLQELTEFTDLRSLADRLLTEFITLPKHYTLILPLPLETTAFTKDLFLNGGFHLAPSLTLVEGSELTNEEFPVSEEEEEEEDNMGFESLLADIFGDRRGPRKWNQTAVYLKSDVTGFIADRLPTRIVEQFSFTVRSFGGLAVAAGPLVIDTRYAPVTDRETVIYVYHGADPPRVKRSQAISNEYAQQLSHIDWAEICAEERPEVSLLYVRACLERIAAAFSDTPTAERLRRAGQWFFDGFCNSSELLAYIQVMVALETMLGDQRSSELMGLGQLLANRCAYLVGSTSKEREEILNDFRELYETRSHIVHRGKNQLTRKERASLWKLRSYCSRTIQEELKLLVAGKAQH
jgi:hypothetical protein